ncbi:MAG TPA: hypothetical protein PKO36_03530 [Candidatus Hydrogenedentes bacterium]|nr:hypothetical protein [Candidatus Hydrogenedentota bacterium]HOV75474.1 hypothetical protein [Candidatus Hydrogenedentota bacterium]
MGAVRGNRQLVFDDKSFPNRALDRVPEKSTAIIPIRHGHWPFSRIGIRRYMSLY